MSVREHHKMISASPTVTSLYAQYGTAVPCAMSAGYLNESKDGQQQRTLAVEGKCSLCDVGGVTL